MSITSSLLEQIKKGREGNNEGLPMGLPKLEGVIDGILPSTYYLMEMVKPAWYYILLSINLLWRI